MLDVHDIGLNDGTGRLKALDNLFGEGSDVAIGGVVDNGNDGLGGPVIGRSAAISCPIETIRRALELFTCSDGLWMVVYSHDGNFSADGWK